MSSHPQGFDEKFVLPSQSASNAPPMTPGTAASTLLDFASAGHNLETETAPQGNAAATLIARPPTDPNTFGNEDNPPINNRPARVSLDTSEENHEPEEPTQETSHEQPPTLSNAAALTEGDPAVIAASKELPKQTMLSSSLATRLEQLKQFKEIHGHCNVPRQHADDKQSNTLGGWVAAQRYKYHQGKLSKERINDLHSIGFQWAHQGLQKAL